MQARRATATDVDAICRICADGWRATYDGLLPTSRVERAIATFYVPDRVQAELEPADGWDGWWVAVDDAGVVVAAGGGGMTGPATGEIFVLYADPSRRGEGAGTAVLDAITRRQLEQGATEQWVAVVEGNDKGIPFYEARGFRPRGTRAAHGEDESAPPSVLFWRPLD
ncbi:MAG TPA: GNAT family N-acetyltransferase [Gaiellaceae bacterium]|jgi:GNAT superfamily N-acetyltransferase